MVAGRPRTVSPSDKECVELGKDLEKWATEKTKEFRCLLGQWWSLKQGLLRSEWNTLKQKKEFLPYYEKAQQAMAVKCLDGTIKEGFAHRYLRLYDRELVEDENEKARFLADLKKESDKENNQKIVFEVNYKNDTDNTVEISPKKLSTTDTPSPEQGN